MELNFTLFIQMGHFFIAYAILKRFLFEPLVRIVYQEDATKSELEQAVQARRILVVQREQVLHDQWQANRAHFARLAPSMQDLEPHLVCPRVHEENTHQMSKDELVQLHHEIKEQLIKKVERAH